MTLHWPDNISTDIFLRDYWQQKPLLIKNAFQGIINLISEEELAGLACEVDVESRLITFDSPENRWQLEHGPLDENRFSKLPASHWTLLVQDVDKHVPAAAEFIKYFDFIPKWRIDDLMISYATDQGSVGPHTDSYDVFLIQLKGKRLWKISDLQYSDQDLLEDCDIKVLTQFQTSDEWLLNPGDMLYLPPHVAHWGIAQGECMTGSVGFISPSSKELFQSWSEYMLEHTAHDQHYQDAELTQPEYPNRIDKHTIKKVRALLQDMITTQPDTLTRWFGEMVSESKPHLQIEPAHEQPLSKTTLSASIAFTDFYRHPYLRAFFTELDEDKIIFFVNGESFELPLSQQAFVHLLCEQHDYPAGSFRDWLDNSDCMDCLVTLINEGCLLRHEAE